MIKKIFNFTKIVISFYFVYFFGNYLIENFEKLNNLFITSLIPILSIISIKIFNIYVNTAIFKQILLTLGINIDFFKAQELTILNNLGNFIGPLKIGSGMRIEYLRQNHNLNIKKFILKNFNFSLYSQILFLLVFVITLYISKFIAFGTLIFIFFFFIILLYLMQKSSILNKKNIFLSVDFINNKILNLLILLLFIFGSWAIFIEINMITENSYSFTKSIFIFQGISITNLINLTPSNLGVREFSLAAINVLHGLNINQLIEIGIIDRFCSITATFIVFTFQNLKKLI